MTARKNYTTSEIHAILEDDHEDIFESDSESDEGKKGCIPIRLLPFCLLFSLECYFAYKCKFLKLCVNS